MADGPLTEFRDEIGPSGTGTIVDNPRGSSSLHVHRDEDESITLMEGALDVTVGDVGFRLQAGQSYFAPRGVPNRLRNPGTVPARGLLLTTPGGFESLVAAAGVPILDSVLPMLPPPTPQQISALMHFAAQYDVTVLEPPEGLLPKDLR